MVDHEQYARYREDSTVLAEIGTRVAAQAGRVTVRLSRELAEAAVTSWERNETGEVAEETHDQHTLRDQAAELALIGLAIARRGRWEGEELVVDLDVDAAGAAVRASL